MKSFINWMGGKGSLKYEILSRFLKAYERYIEVFGGGGSILFEKSPSKFEVYNDFNNNLVNLPFHSRCCVINDVNDIKILRVEI